MPLATIAAEPAELTIDLDTTALVIIDMQRDFLEPGGFGASLGNDLYLLEACTMITVAMATLTQTVSDLGYLVLNPRMRPT